MYNKLKSILKLSLEELKKIKKENKDLKEENLYLKKKIKKKKNNKFIIIFFIILIGGFIFGFLLIKLFKIKINIKCPKHSLIKKERKKLIILNPENETVRLKENNI